MIPGTAVSGISALSFASCNYFAYCTRRRASLNRLKRLPSSPPLIPEYYDLGILAAFLAFHYIFQSANININHGRVVIWPCLLFTYAN